MSDDDGASMDGGLSPLDPEAPAETPEDWKAFVDFQPNGRVLRSSPVMAGGDIDLWSPDGACEEMLIEQQAVQVRKRQDDGRCRVDGCERQAPKAPFLCEYHATGEFYTVAVMDIERGGSRWINIKLCQRLPKHWEYLKNFTRKKNGKFNLTCRLCCVKASSYVPKSGIKPRAGGAGSRGTKRSRDSGSGAGSGSRSGRGSRGGASSRRRTAAAGSTSGYSVGSSDGAPAAARAPKAASPTRPAARRFVEVVLAGSPIGNIAILPSTTLRQCRESLIPRIARPPVEAFVFLLHAAPVDPGHEALVLASEAIDQPFGKAQLHLLLSSGTQRRRGYSFGGSSNASPRAVGGASAHSGPSDSHQFGDAFGEALFGTSTGFTNDLVADLPTLGGFGAVPDPQHAWGVGIGSLSSISGLPTSSVAHVQVGVDNGTFSTGFGGASVSVAATPTSIGDFRGRTQSDVQAAGALRARNAASRGAMHALTPDDCPDGYAFPAGSNCEEVLVSKGILSDGATGQRCRVLGCENTPPLHGTRMCAYHSQNALFMVETLDTRGNFVRCFARLCRSTNTWEWASAFSMDSTCAAHASGPAVAAAQAAAASTVATGAAVVAAPVATDQGAAPVPTLAGVAASAPSAPSEFNGPTTASAGKAGRGNEDVQNGDATSL